MKTKIYLSHKQITALEEGVKELTQFNDIQQTLSIHNNGEGKGSWIDLDEPSINFLFWLGVQTGINIGTKTTYIKKSWTDDTGGGMMVDYVELSTDQILGITDESVTLYENMESVEAGDAPLNSIGLTGAGITPANSYLIDGLNNFNLQVLFNNEHYKLGEKYGYKITPSEGGGCLLRLYEVTDTSYVELDAVAYEYEHASEKDVKQDIKLLISVGFQFEEVYANDKKQSPAIFLAKCNDGGGRWPQQLDIQHIRDNWDLAETSDDTVILGAYLQDAEIGDTWVNGTDELERIS